MRLHARTGPLILGLKRETIGGYAVTLGMHTFLINPLQEKVRAPEAVKGCTVHAHSQRSLHKNPPIKSAPRRPEEKVGAQ